MYGTLNQTRHLCRECAGLVCKQGTCQLGSELGNGEEYEVPRSIAPTPPTHGAHGGIIGGPASPRPETAPPAYSNCTLGGSVGCADAACARGRGTPIRKGVVGAGFPVSYSAHWQSGNSPSTVLSGLKQLHHPHHAAEGEGMERTAQTSAPRSYCSGSHSRSSANSRRAAHTPPRAAVPAPRGKERRGEIGVVVRRKVGMVGTATCANGFADAKMASAAFSNNAGTLMECAVFELDVTGFQIKALSLTSDLPVLECLHQCFACRMPEYFQQQGAAVNLTGHMPEYFQAQRNGFKGQPLNVLQHSPKLH
ncbi:hypothetical protein B0H17DRAFT_1137366 [Mycena rosella]|uniref:Uncharacterized protein n=1 Tax=Mycena rosella TaxID=1033263 RepID=A0AAD7D8N9_MYCRO|nr:hypothetical protein B0H17DRAFT_1137366 [Mycena rosella]